MRLASGPWSASCLALLACAGCGGAGDGGPSCGSETLCTTGTALCCGEGYPGTWNPAAPGPLRCTCPAPGTPHRPAIPDRSCLIDLARWGIYADGTHAPETTDGINAAIAATVAEGCGRIGLPAGTYLIGKPYADYATDGIHLLSRMALVLDPGAVLQMVTNDSPFYTLLDLDGVHDVEITGGTLRGDRPTHSFDNPGAPGNETHEFGYLIYVEGAGGTNSGVVWIHDIELADATGDGITIEPQGAGASCTDVTITGCNIHHNRRQGISIVGGTRVLIENNEIHHIAGTAPQFGIDIESEDHASRDVVVRNNRFHDNAGGDFVKCDGNNILFEGNTCEQGELASQTDGPVVFWREGDVTIRGNSITMTVPTANGRLGILEYALGTKDTGIPAVIAGNVLEGCGIYAYDDAHVVVVDNRVHEHFVAMKNVQDLLLTGNSIDATTDWYGYLLQNVTGSASGNTRNGAAVNLPLSADEPFSNAGDL
jgi:parallel beta-helix repeat protein